MNEYVKHRTRGKPYEEMLDNPPRDVLNVVRTSLSKCPIEFDQRNLDLPFLTVRSRYRNIALGMIRNWNFLREIAPALST